MARSRSSSGGADAVRRSLDRRAVDAESEDRPYLVSMLRRLGYTETQIQDYLAGRQDPEAPAPAAQSEDAVHAAPPAAPSASAESARVEPDHGGERDVEVEYTGPGLQDYRLVDPVDFFGGDSPAADAGEHDDGALVEFQAGEPAADAWGADTGSDGQPLAEFVAVPPAEAAAAPAADAWGAEPEPAPPQEAPSGPVAEPDLAWEEAPEAPAEEAPWPDTPAEAAPPEPQDQTISYGDYTLYEKEEARDGQPVRVFAFSKTPPGEGYGPATEVPEGYQVAENPETGRPFLRRAGEEEWGAVEAAGAPSAGPEGGEPARRRVRLKRVRAANREEAMRLVEREGGTPLASVPIDIEKHLGDQ